MRQIGLALENALYRSRAKCTSSLAGLKIGTSDFFIDASNPVDADSRGWATCPGPMRYKLGTQPLFS